MIGLFRCALWPRRGGPWRLRVCYRKNEEGRKKSLCVAARKGRTASTKTSQLAGFSVPQQSNRRFGPTKLLATGEISCNRCSHIAYVLKE